MRDIIEELLKIDRKGLKDKQLVADLIREYGLHNDPCVVHLFDKDDHKYLVTQGMLQIPEQMAGALIYLSKYLIDSYLEIGTFNGRSTLFITAYLSRFNPTLEVITVDNLREFTNPYPKLNIAQHIGTSNDLTGRKSDLCFIDGNHSTEWIKRDYENVGQFAKICMFHDILETEVINNNDMGVKTFWQSIKRPTSVEFTDGGRMGIGIL